jgi:hypothetical protein
MIRAANKPPAADPEPSAFDNFVVVNGDAPLSDEAVDALARLLIELVTTEDDDQSVAEPLGQ